MKYMLVLVASLFAVNAGAGIIYSDDLGRVNKGSTSYLTDYVGKQTDWLKDATIHVDLDIGDTVKTETIKLPVSITTEFSTTKGLEWTNVGSKDVDKSTTVPEPSVLALLAVGLIGVAAVKRRNSTQS